MMNNYKKSEKGKFGESLVREWIESKGYVVYEPVTNAAHPFDKLIVKDKIEFRIVEVKTKPRMKKYKATGFDTNHYHYYISSVENLHIPIYVFFVDNVLGKILYQDLELLSLPFIDSDGKEWPNETIAKGIVLFHLEQMIEARRLTDDEINKLNLLTQSNY